MSERERKRKGKKRNSHNRERRTSVKGKGGRRRKGKREEGIVEVHKLEEGLTVVDNLLANIEAGRLPNDH